MSIRSKIENSSVGKILFVTFICISILMILWVKILGASNVGINIEKGGYCKQYGEDWNYKENNLCVYKTEEKQPIEFTEEEFKDYCPDHKFFSNTFYSECFNLNKQNEHSQPNNKDS